MKRRDLVAMLAVLFEILGAMLMWILAMIAR